MKVPASGASAEAVFAEYLAERSRGGGRNLEAFCAEHPRLRRDLLRLHAGWARVQGLFRGEPSTSLAARTEATLGEAAAPGAGGLRAPGDSAPSRYTVLGEVARGGMGAVLRVWDRELHRAPAMKVLQDGGVAGPAPRAVARFIEEAQVAGQLQHPGIVPVHDVGTDDTGRPYYTMPLVRGGTLEHVFERARREGRRGNLPRALESVARACEAVAAAHARGVVHRDLKPANVMVGAFGEVYVMDWGLARVLSVEPEDAVRTTRGELASAPDSPLATREGEALGTPTYMPPEQARGERERVGPASDVYSLGAMLYELVSGRKPYRGEGEEPSALVVLRRVAAGPPEPLSALAPRAPRELVAICERAMAREPEGRYPDARALAVDLRAWLEQRVVAAHRTGAWAELVKWVQRNRLPAAASFLALVLIALGFATSRALLARARTSAAEAVAERTELLRLADLKRLRDLRARAAELWPMHPDTAPGYRTWLADAGALAERLPLHERDLAELAGRGPAGSAEVRWRRAKLEELVEGLRALSDPGTGGLADVRRRLAAAESLERETVTGPLVAEAWREAIAAVAASPEYGGLALGPQVGLVPLGADPRSGLHEFAVALTGEVPERGPDGLLGIDEDAAVVLVLLPGGRFLMGAQAEDPSAPNHHAEVGELEGPVHAVELRPAFVSKYELTQGQWLRLTGENPSTYTGRYEWQGVRPDGTHPVETVSWDEAVAALRRVGLRLPTEAEWEYAARGGTSTPWWTGAEKESLLDAVNLADRTAARGGAPWPDIADWPELDDGYYVTAPVDTLRPNPFGLHHVHGNVDEWCLDPWVDHSRARSAGAPEEEGEEAVRRAHRGGNFGVKAFNARSSFRENERRDVGSHVLGVRPWRPAEG